MNITQLVVTISSILVGELLVLTRVIFPGSVQQHGPSWAIGNGSIGYYNKVNGGMNVQTYQRYFKVFPFRRVCEMTLF
jgi:hypothetical protein